MSGAEVGIAAAGAASKVLFSKTCYDFFFKWKLDSKLLTDLETQVNVAKAVLNDAEMRLIVKGPFVDNWLQKLRYAILDAEDLLDTILTDINKEKYRLGDSPGTKAIIKEKLKYKGKDIVRTIHPYKNTREAEMTEIIQNLQNIIAQVSHLGLDKNDELTKLRENRIATSCGIDPSKIIGRSEDEKKILELLNSREGNDDALRVIPIVGMGGVGKTTLASLVYKGYKTSGQSFQVQGWVCVSDKFQLAHVISSLIKSITKGDAKAGDTSDFLKGLLQNKRFLLVLDDIWSGFEDKWEFLQTIFSGGAPGSRIIITTRDEKVADIVTKNSDQSSYQLYGLSDADGWSLLQSHAFKNGDSSAHPILEKIGMEIVGKCKGLPLAIQMLGSVLFLKKNDEREWKLVLNSKIWNSTSKILPSLWLSYYHLPLPVKQCFAYLSIFPKDYSFSMEEIVMLWVAEGFLEKPGESNNRSFDYEHLGRTYFDDLRSNFFIQKSISDPSEFVMHNLVHDLAEYVSKDLLVNLADINPKSRRLSNFDKEILLSTRSVQTLSRLRTFLPRQHYFRSSCVLNDKICKDLLSNFKLLRVLSLESSGISVLPASVGDMKLLRYLNLSGTCIEYLPQWICRLHNLQILKLVFCLNLKRLPASLCDLVNLRELNVERTELISMPYGIGGMTNLRKLPEFVLGEGNSKQLKEFENLNNLHGRLEISQLNNVVDVKDVVTASFGNKEFLEELVLKWKSNREREAHLEERVLDAMEPHKSLKRLTIHSYGGKRLPNWIVGAAPSFTSMVFLRISYCFNCEALPSIGAMPFLEQLDIESLDSLEFLGTEFYGDADNPFLALQRLNISNMEVLKTWSFGRGGKIGFSSLKELRIVYCGQLTEIPCCFPSLTFFEIRGCGNLPRLAFVGNFPFLKDMIIDGLDSLQSLGPDFYGDGYNPFPALENLRITRMKVLKKWCFPGGGSAGFSCLKALYIRECPELTEIPFCFPGLIKLEIYSCRNLVSLDMWDAEEKGSVSSSTLYGHSLLSISIAYCDKLEEIPKSFVNLAKIYICECKSLVSVPGLQHVQDLEHCRRSLRTIPNQFLRGCSKHLEDLELYSCPKLACLPDVLSALESLRILHLESCPLIQHFPASSGLLFKSLWFLKIIDCPILESLPVGFHNITTLKKLIIKKCPNLVVPEDGLPAMISVLKIKNCGKMDPVSKLKLSKLTSLTYLDLQGFPKTITLDHCIPESIERLTIKDFPRLKSISEVLPTLKLLKRTEFIDCLFLND